MDLNESWGLAGFQIFEKYIWEFPCVSNSIPDCHKKNRLYNNMIYNNHDFYSPRYFIYGPPVQFMP